LVGDKGCKRKEGRLRTGEEVLQRAGRKRKGWERSCDKELGGRGKDGRGGVTKSWEKRKGWERRCDKELGKEKRMGEEV
jgi:hypothetical protein